MKKILFSLVAILLAVGLVGAGAFAQFFDTETTGKKTFSADTLDLKVSGNMEYTNWLTEFPGDSPIYQDPYTEHIVIEDIAPGWEKWGYKGGDPDTSGYLFVVKNDGTTKGYLSVEFSDITNKENGFTEPEYNPNTGVYADGEGPGGEGELGAHLKVTIQVTGIYKMGPGTHPWWPMGKEGVILNAAGGNTYPVSGGGGLLKAGEEETVMLSVKLLPTGNCVQSDSVEFDIIFHLDQAP